MLRKTTHIVLVLFLLVATSGVTISMHFCGGKWVSTSINKEAKSCCDGMGGCCKNKTLHFEVKEDYVSPLQLQNVKIVELDVLFPILIAPVIRVLIDTELVAEIFNDTSPPPDIQTRLAFLQTYLC